LKKKKFKDGDKVLLFNSRFKTFRKGKLQRKWDGPYIVHSVLSNGAVTIMDVKGDQFMVNGQRLKVYYEPDVVPLHHIDVFTIEEEPRTKNKVLIFVNSFSFIFLEFLAKFYRANFLSWAKNVKYENAEQGAPAGPVRPAQGGSSGGSPRFFPRTCLFDFLLWSENFKGSLKK
jgi:hypothetical protein